MFKIRLGVFSSGTRYEYRPPELRGLVLIDKVDVLMCLDPASLTATVKTVHRSPATVELVLKNYRAALAGRERLTRSADQCGNAQAATGKRPLTEDVG